METLYPIGIQNFEKIHNDGYLYIDKTALMYQMVKTGSYYFLSRPRRFGKSLLISTLEAYFQGKKELFTGLAVERLEKDWIKYPILHLDLNIEKYDTPESLDNILEKSLTAWEKLYGAEPSERSFSLRFAGIIERACKQAGQRVVILVDEYDKPMLQAIGNEELQKQFRNTLKPFYGALKTMDGYIKFAFLTGVTKFGKVSVFSDLNNLDDISMRKDYVEICRHRGLDDEAALAEKAIADMEKTVLDAGWDGEWFLRAYDHYKNKIGSKECEEGKIFIEPQGFCVMAEIGLKEGNCLKAMQSVEKYLDTKYGIVLLQPAYHRYHVELGEISSYPPGYKENAGIFCHNNPWISIAETVVGRGNRAWQVYTRTCPAYIEDISEIHRTEPYVYSQMIAGKDAKNFGEAKNSWLTGTAAWTFLDVSQYILGIRPDYDGLVVDPCIPSTLDGFEAKRDFRGVTYHITVKNPKHVEKGVSSMTVDGVSVAGNMIPLPTDKKEVTVEVVMG